MTIATETTVSWDAAEYLTTQADIAEYLAAASETGNAADITHALATITRLRGTTESQKPPASPPPASEGSVANR